jgi:hypothetical protein
MSADTKELKSIDQLIKDGEWDLVREWYETHPQEVTQINPTNNSTVLHAICYISSAPIDLFEYIVDTFPEALTIQERRFGTIPLHVLCWSSQRSRRKVEILLERMKPKDLLIRNSILGSTPLHSACGNNAELPVIKAIVRKYPPVVLAKTFDQSQTALNALWHSHLQTIPGHMQIARILKGDEVNEGHFNRFWTKCQYLATESFKLSPACPPELIVDNDDDDDDGDKNEEINMYVLHGLLDLKAPLNALKTAIKINPSWASYPDADGNYPLHHVVKRRPFRVKDIELIRELLQVYPDAASKRNNAGDLPIHLAIRDRMVWEEGLGDIATANPDVLGVPDQHTNLYPFLMAASLSGRVAVNTTYQLLLAKPYLVKDAIED